MLPDNKFVRSLVQNAQRGNFTALDQLFRMNIGKVYAVVLRMTANKSFASRITVDTFIEAWKKLKLIREDSPFTGWLIAIAVYKTLDVFRNNKEEFAKKPDLSEIESKDSFENDILRLPHLERLIFVLNKVEKYSVDEVADMIMMKKEDVEFHLNLAIEKLHDKYPLYKFDNSFQERISKLPIEIQPDKSVADEIFNYIYEERLKLTEKENQEEKKIKSETVKSAKEEKPKKEKKQKEKKKHVEMPEVTLEVKPFSVKKYLPWIIGIILIIVAGYFYLTRAKDWNIVELSGNVLLNNEKINSSTDFSVKSILQTGDNSTARLSVAKVGILEVDSNTKLSRTKSNEIKLDEGRIVKKPVEQTEKIVILTDRADFNEELNSEFELAVKEETDNLFVYRGTVRVNLRGFESIVPEGFACEVKKGRYVIPFNSGTEPQLINLLKDFTGPTDPNLVLITGLATPKDALSLWHVLQLTSELNRQIPLNKLKELIPPPESVSDEGIMKLDREMLDQWLIKILANR